MSATPAPIPVMVLEDQPKPRNALALLLDGTPGFRCVGAHASGESALRHLSPTPPAVVLVDLELPGMSGIEFLRQCRRRLPAVGLLVLTVHDESGWVFPALAAGANGYLVKGTPPAKLLEAIVEIHAGCSSMSGAVARLVLDSFHRPAARTIPDEPLTTQEGKVLALLARGLRYADIADELGISPRTVNSHLYHIYQKLHVHSAAGAVGKLIHPTQSEKGKAWRG